MKIFNDFNRWYDNLKPTPRFLFFLFCIVLPIIFSINPNFGLPLFLRIIILLQFLAITISRMIFNFNKNIKK